MNNYNKTTSQVEITTDTGDVQLPVGTHLIAINGNDFDQTTLNNLTEETFTSVTFRLPRRPPSLPDYIVVRVAGYSECGGPSFFPTGGEQMKDYVLVTYF